MYHYTESGLQKVWLENGYTIHDTPYGPGVSIQDVDGLHRTIGRIIAQRPRLTGAELRFLRKEMELSQRALAAMLGVTEQIVSLWERKGRVPKTTARLVKLLYLEHLDGNVGVRNMIERFANQDDAGAEDLRLKAKAGQWKQAA